MTPFGQFYFISGEFTRMLGYTSEDMMDRHFTTIIHPDDLQVCINTIEVLVKYGKAPGNVVFRVLRKDEGFRWVDCSAICLFDNQQQPTHIIGFAHDVTELVKSQELLAIENKRVAQAVVDAQEQERAEIGYELHDNVNQILSTSRLYLDLAKNDEKERLNLIARSGAGLSQAISEIRKISRSLVPASINDLGLVASIHDLVENIQSTRTLQVEFHHEGDIDSIVSDKPKLMLFRIIQEQVTNVLKHAEASLLIIELVVDKCFINLSISDNGKGFDKEAVKTKKGVGLHNIANRTELFNGTVNMMTSPGNGCKLNILVPV